MFREEELEKMAFELEVRTYKRMYPDEDMEKVLNGEPLTIDELERIDYLVDTLKLPNLKFYMTQKYSATYTELVNSLTNQEWKEDSLEKMNNKYREWKYNNKVDPDIYELMKANGLISVQ